MFCGPATAVIWIEISSCITPAGPAIVIAHSPFYKKTAILVFTLPEE
jgi:hypothetical protein